MSWTRSRSDSNEFFSYQIDRWKGITIKSEEQYCDETTFRGKLLSSFPQWMNEGVRTVWFYISVNHSKWIPVLTDNDFVFHRAEDSGKSVVMFKWLVSNSTCHIPPAAHTMVGVGGIVTNSKQEILVVQENFMPSMHWKLPGGLVDFGEDLTSAGIREVMEETGIRTEFKSCVSFRHTHGANFGYSDLYFIVHMIALNENIEVDNHEVVAAQWMSTEEYLNHEHIHELNKMFLKIFLKNTEQKISVLVQDGLHPVTKKPYVLYSPAGSST